MKIASRSCSAALLFLTLLFFGCGPTFQAAGSIAQGRQALFRGDYEAALGYFQSAYQTDPNYVYGTDMQEGVLSYVGRAQYLTGALAQAHQTLERDLSVREGDHIARLYLGMTLARQDDRKVGLQQMEAGMKAIEAFINYMVTAFGSGSGQFWDPDRDIRNAIANNLTIMGRGDFDWSTVIASGESIAMKTEREPDQVRLDRERYIQMNAPR
jgi:tetratricopeptide (TPR) repeat protein